MSGRRPGRVASRATPPASIRRGAVRRSLGGRVQDVDSRAPSGRATASHAGDGAGRWLGGEPLLLGLLVSLDLAAGLGMVGAGVVEPDPEPAELDLRETRL